jgi:hypothetical protein
MSVSQSELNEMRKLLLFSKKLSDWHVRNLNMWPQIVFNRDAKCAPTKIEIDYAIGDRPDECYVNYLVRFKNKRLPSDFKRRCEALEKWVKDLFWADMNFAVKDMDGNILYPKAAADERK